MLSNFFKVKKKKKIWNEFQKQLLRNQCYFFSIGSPLHCQHFLFSFSFHCFFFKYKTLQFYNSLRVHFKIVFEAIFYLGMLLILSQFSNDSYSIIYMTQGSRWGLFISLKRNNFTVLIVLEILYLRDEPLQLMVCDVRSLEVGGPCSCSAGLIGSRV